MGYEALVEKMARAALNAAGAAVERQVPDEREPTLESRPEGAVLPKGLDEAAQEWAASHGYRNARQWVAADPISAFKAGAVWRAALIAEEPRADAVKALIEAGRSLRDFYVLLDSGMTVFPFDEQHPDSASNTCNRILDTLFAALRDVELGAESRETDAR